MSRRLSLHEELLEKIFSACPLPEAEGAEGPDVSAWLDGRAAEVGGDLDWRCSVVDLLRLLELDPAWDRRQQMAVELGFPKEEVHARGSAELNLWLLKAVADKIVERGGRIAINLPV
ncbi:MAG: DUF3597 family protein [Verrucomicrobiales bacterium]|nr:DUF3597 family protein [Verrucomicrobiales bacterium]